MNTLIDDIRHKTFSIKEAAKTLGMKYHAARNRIIKEKAIRYFDYYGKISVVEDDIRIFKKDAYVTPINKNNLDTKKDVSDLEVITVEEMASILDMNYHPALRRLRNERLIGYFDYSGKISVVKDDVFEYKLNHFRKE